MYSISVKIKFSTDMDTLGLCLCGSQLLAPLHVHVVSSRPPFWEYQPIAIIDMLAKIGKVERDKQHFTCLKCHLLLDCVLVEQRAMAKGL